MRLRKSGRRASLLAMGDLGQVSNSQDPDPSDIGRMPYVPFPSFTLDSMSLEFESPGTGLATDLPTVLSDC